MAVTRADGADFDAKMAGADLRGKVNHLAALNSDGELVLPSNGGVVYGIITEDGNTGQPVTVQVQGLGKAVAGGSVTAGTRVMSNGDGEVVTGTGASNQSFGIARNSADEGEMVEIHIDRTRGH